MRNEQHPGGVAGRVLETLKINADECDDFPSIDRWMLKWNGAKGLHQELSREARAILAELETEAERAEVWDEYDQSILIRQLALRGAFQRLGLDLEREDAE